MSKAKSFDKGEEVEVQRTVGGPWLRVVYANKVALSSKSGYHRVRGEALKHYIDSMTGIDTNAENPRAYLMITDVVPSCRIRKIGPR